MPKLLWIWECDRFAQPSPYFIASYRLGYKERTASVAIMSVYSLDHIIQECIGDRLTVHSTARGKSNDAKVEIYSSSWLTLNAWIESRLSRHKVERFHSPFFLQIISPNF